MRLLLSLLPVLLALGCASADPYATSANPLPISLSVASPADESSEPTPGSKVVQLVVDDRRKLADAKRVGKVAWGVAPGVDAALISDELPVELARRYISESLRRSGYTPRKKLRLQPMPGPNLYAEIKELWSHLSVAKQTMALEISLSLTSDNSTNVVWQRSCRVQRQPKGFHWSWPALASSQKENFEALFRDAQLQLEESFKSTAFRESINSLEPNR